MAGGKAVVNDGCERQAAVNACERGCEHAGNAAHRSLSRISHRDRNIEPTQRPDLPRVGTATGRARWGAILVRTGARNGTATVRTTETPRKSWGKSGTRSVRNLTEPLERFTPCAELW